jgi:ribonuclease-3
VPDDLDRLQTRLGYSFNDPSLLEWALTHRSAHRSRNNERLEFLGDAYLGQVIAARLFEAFPAASEGQLTRMRARLVRGHTLAEIARELELGPYLVLGGGELKSGGHRRDSILADALEALIGAIVLDAGSAACEEAVGRWFARRLNEISPEAVDKDAKTRLQEWLQARQFRLPEYEVERVEGQAPKQTFHVLCRLPDMEHSVPASGSSRRKAEQSAARAALNWLDDQGEHGQ